MGFNAGKYYDSPGYQDSDSNTDNNIPYTADDLFHATILRLNDSTYFCFYSHGPYSIRHLVKRLADNGYGISLDISNVYYPSPVKPNFITKYL